MNPPPTAHGWRPGLRSTVLLLSGVLIVVAALAVSWTVSDHLARTATEEAVRTTEAVVRAYVDPMVASRGLTGLSAADGAEVDAQLERLVASGKFLRIKMWAPDGTVVFADLAALRG